MLASQSNFPCPVSLRLTRQPLALAISAVLALSSQTLYAATINVDADAVDTDTASGNCSLVEAIQAANTDTAVDNCTAGNGTDTIVLASGGTYSLTAVNDVSRGDTGLPAISTAMTIQGNGATIERSGSTAFRLLVVTSTGDLTLDSVTLSNGRSSGTFGFPGYGGGILNNGGQLTLTNSTVTSNYAGYSGGGIHTDRDGLANPIGEGNTTITNSVISNNESRRGGGGIFHGGGSTSGSGTPLQISNSTISGNMSGSTGGGIDMNNIATLNLVNSTVSNNSATFYGGGIATSEQNIVPTNLTTITNSTISGNSAGMAGGGLHLGGDVTLTTTTVFGNTTGTAGGALNQRTPDVGSTLGTITLDTSIIAGTVGGADCSGTITNNNSLIQDNSCGGAASLSGDPMLEALADNGGSTQTHALSTGSPAIDAGGSCGQTTDQRGETRDSNCDLGAYEAAPQQPEPDVAVDVGNDGNFLADGTTNITVDFGTLQQNTSTNTSITLVFDNVGGTNLVLLPEPMTSGVFVPMLTDGTTFSFDTSFFANTIGPTAATSRLAVLMDTSTVGTFNDSFALSANDPDEAMLNFTITGTVDAPADPGIVGFIQSSFTIDENDGTATIEVSRTGQADGAASIDYALTADTATAGTDYTDTSGTLNWSDGETGNKSFDIAIIDDTDVEGNEGLTLALGNPSPAALGIATDTATLTIVDDDMSVQSGQAQFAEVQGQSGTTTSGTLSITVPENVGDLTVEVSRTGGSDGDVDIDFNVMSGSGTMATPMDDFTGGDGILSWSDGDSTNQTFTISIVDDAVEETMPETFFIELSNPQGGLLTGSPATLSVTITDNDEGVIGLAFDASGMPISTNARFVDTLDGNRVNTSTPLMLNTSDTHTTVIRINVDPAHQGQAAGVLLLGSYQAPGASTPVLYQRQSSQQWVPFTATAMQPYPTPIDNITSLPAQVEIPIHMGALAGLPGVYMFFAGYQLADGTLVYNGNSIQTWSVQ